MMAATLVLLAVWVFALVALGLCRELLIPQTAVQLKWQAIAAISEFGGCSRHGASVGKRRAVTGASSHRSTLKAKP
jgi:hypothetical protein